MSSVVNTLCGGFRPAGLAALSGRGVPMNPLPKSPRRVSKRGAAAERGAREGIAAYEKICLFNSAADRREVRCRHIERPGLVRRQAGLGEYGREYLRLDGHGEGGIAGETHTDDPNPT